MDILGVNLGSHDAEATLLKERAADVDDRSVKVKLEKEGAGRISY